MSALTRVRGRRKLAVLAGSVLAAGAVLTAEVTAAPPGSPDLSPVPTANTKSDGFSPPSRLSAGLTQVAVAQGSTKLENPSDLTSYYGYFNDVVNAAGEPQMLPTPTTNDEAQKSEPDKNTYLVMRGLTGADPHYDYGRHYVFQGHEGGVNGASYLTRINLDADAQHKVTLLATKDTSGQPIAPIDGSTWDPWAQRLLLTTEDSGEPIYSATPGYPSTVVDISGSLGRGGYEGIQNDSAGNIWIVEDSGGSFKGNTKAKRPNSFVYRYVPRRPGDLEHGKLQVLQVLNDDGNPITFDSQAALNSPDQLALHTYGKAFRTRWITIHDTATDGNTTPFDANALAKAADGTPFKRPENGQFQPGDRFRDFYFDETGDTDATSPENDTAGGWDSVFHLSQSNPSANTGQLTLFFKGDEAHAGFDNVAFLSHNLVTFVEDAGDTLHTQRNALDSGFVFDVRDDYSKPSNQPVRWLAEGRDPSATIDSANDGFGKNEGDNEITGAHVSNGDPGKNGVLGAKNPNLSNGKWRWFYTQQHGDNTTWEVLLNRR
jgi:hypothetical protein